MKKIHLLLAVLLTLPSLLAADRRKGSDRVLFEVASSRIDKQNPDNVQLINEVTEAIRNYLIGHAGLTADDYFFTSCTGGRSRCGQESR